MTHTHTPDDWNRIGQGYVGLKNINSAIQAGCTISRTVIADFELTLKSVIDEATKVHSAFVAQKVSNATRDLMEEGWEVVAPKVASTPSSLDIAIALLVRNGYKVTDPNGGNC